MSKEQRADGEPWDIPGLRLQYDVAPGHWLLTQFRPADQCDVGAWTPKSFDAYVRIAYPFRELTSGRLIRWSELAQRSGEAVGPSTAARELLSRERASIDGQKIFALAQLPDEELRILTSLLRTHSETPDSTWLCIWEGYGDLGLQPDPRPKEPPRLRFPDRDRQYVLYRGGADAPLLVREGHNYMGDIWWPDDRAWVLTTDTDFDWVYLAGSTDVIEDLVSAPGLEVFVTGPDDPAG